MEDFMDQKRGKPHRRLIEKNQLRCCHQCASDNGHLLLSSAYEAGRLGPLLPEPGEIIVYHLQALLDIPSILLLHMGADFKIFLNRQMLEDLSAFNHLNYAHLGDFFSLHPVYPLTHEFDGPIGDFPILMVKKT